MQLTLNIEITYLWQMDAIKLFIGTCLLFLAQICLSQVTELDSILSFEMFEGEWEQTATSKYEYISPQELKINHYEFDSFGNRELSNEIYRIFNGNGDIIELRREWESGSKLKTTFEYDQNFNNIGKYNLIFDSENEIWLKWYGVEFEDFDGFGNYQTKNNLIGSNDENAWQITARYNYEYSYNAEDLVDSLTIFEGQEIKGTKGYLYNENGLEVECTHYYSFDNSKIQKKSIKNYSSNGLLLDHTNMCHDYLNDEYYVDTKLNYFYDEDERLIMQINQDRFEDMPVFFKYDFFYQNEVVENARNLDVKWFNTLGGNVEVNIDGFIHGDNFRIQVFNMEGKLVKLLNIQNSDSWSGSFQLDSGMYSLVILNDIYLIHAEKIMSLR